MDDLLGLAPADIKEKIAPIDPRPPSGLVPTQLSFLTIPDSLMLNSAGKMIYVGGGPGGLNGLASYTEPGPEQRRCEGKLWGNTADGRMMFMRMYNAGELASMGAQVPAAWTLAENELVLGSTFARVALENVGAPLLGVPEAARWQCEIEFGKSSIRVMRLKIDEATLELSAIEEPVTPQMITDNLSRIARFVDYDRRQAVGDKMRNEARHQMVPENQKNMAFATATVDIAWSDFRMTDAGKKAEWEGDAAGTYTHYFIDEAELSSFWSPSAPKLNGWVIPEKPADKRGSKRRRTARQQGYVLVMMHDDRNLTGANKISYCIETKKATLVLSLALFGVNMKFKQGASLPPRPDGVPNEHQFDIVTRSFVDRTTTTVWSEARSVRSFIKNRTARTARTASALPPHRLMLVSVPPCCSVSILATTNHPLANHHQGHWFGVQGPRGSVCGPMRGGAARHFCRFTLLLCSVVASEGPGSMLHGSNVVRVRTIHTHPYTHPYTHQIGSNAHFCAETLGSAAALARVESSQLETLRLREWCE